MSITTSTKVAGDAHAAIAQDVAAKIARSIRTGAMILARRPPTVTFVASGRERSGPLSFAAFEPRSTGTRARAHTERPSKGTTHRMKSARTPWMGLAMTVIALGAACTRRSASANEQGSASDAPERALEEMSVEALSGMIDRGETVAVFDANGRERYEQGHIPSARHVGHDRITADSLPQNRATPLVFYCYNER